MGKPDKAVLSLGGEQLSRDLGTISATDSTVTDTIHCSGAYGATLTASSIIGGSEDCIDFNNTSHDLAIKVEYLESGGKYVSTIKGGSYRIYLGGVIHLHGSEVDVDLGNWSDQSSALTMAVTLDLKSSDGSPVTYRILNASKPILAPGSGPYRCIFHLPPILIKPVWFFWGLLKRLKILA